MRFVKTIGMGLAIITLAGGPAVAQAAYADWNSNGDATGIDYNEFGSNFDRLGVYSKWDADNDGTLTENEFMAGVGEKRDRFNERFGADAFDKWDANNDKALTTDEFRQGVFKVYDADADKVIEEPEFGDLGDDVGDGGFWDI